MFFIKSEEEFALCPNCGNRLLYHCRVIRTLTDKESNKSHYSIRVLKCDNKACPTTYHRELPNTIVPYKRFDAESIEEAISLERSDIAVSADESTIWRWRKWFKVSAVYIMMALVSVAATVDVETSSLINSNNNIEQIKEIVGQKVNWLKETVRILVNSSKWVNRSAFLTG